MKTDERRPASPISGEDALWQAWTSTGDPKARSALIEGHYPLVTVVARSIRRRLPAHVDLDDLVSCGALGLIDAVDKFDPGRAVPFSSYAVSRIRGAIFDGLRQTDWLPRSLRPKVRAANDAVEALSGSLGREPRRHELAEHLGVSAAELTAVLDHARSVPLELWADNRARPDHETDPEELALETALREAVHHEIACLPERGRRVISLYFLEGRALKEIGEQVGFTESRASQVKTAMLARMRKAMVADWAA